MGRIILALGRWDEYYLPVISLAILELLRVVRILAKSHILALIVVERILARRDQSLRLKVTRISNVGPADLRYLERWLRFMHE